jgi:very-short-patch-repair endonuclease
MAKEPDEPRIWARIDRSAVKPANHVRARAMRKAPTEAEKRLWWHLRNLKSAFGVHFRRQVHLGPYIVDFVSHSTKLIIEVDGGQHDVQARADAVRTRFLEREGYRVLRFWNVDVLKNIDGVLQTISDALTTTTPTPAPSPQGGGEKKSHA